MKAADPEALRSIAKRVAEWASAGYFPGHFTRETVLVPVPGRAPRKGPDTLWVPERICASLHAAGLGREIWTALERTRAIPKSAWAERGGRPELQVHRESLSVTSRLPSARAVLLVDDFVTKGRTLLAVRIPLIVTGGSGRT